MILPFLDGFLRFSKAPITWILILLNVFLFSHNQEISKQCHEQFQSWYQDEDFLYTQGQLYRQYSSQRDIAKVKDVAVLGRLAFRDESFIRQALERQWTGDQIAIQSWKQRLEKFLVIRAYYPPIRLGVSEVHKDFFSTLSYQFYHDGLGHLLGNVLLILIVGGFLERKYSGLVVFMTYVVGGSVAAFVFMFSQSLSSAPLVGASGSLCALLGLLCVTHYKKKTRLFYMILPLKNYMGFVFVPTVYWVLLFCMAEDVSGWLSQPSIFAGGVAHGVHLVGFAIGGGLAVLLKMGGFLSETSVKSKALAEA